MSRRVKAALALLAVAAAALLASTRVETGPSGQTLGQDRGVNAGAGDLADISAHNSPSLARNPRDRRNLVVTSRIDTPDFSCAVHRSVDSGANWAPTRVPIPRGEGPKCYAPDAVFAADGTLHVTYVTLKGTGNRPNAVWLATSRDGGRTLSPPRRVAGPLAFQVRIAADPAGAGRLYLTWVQAREVGQLKFTGPGNPIVSTRSDDGGATWGRPVPVNDGGRGRVVAPSAAVGPDGELYVLFLDVGDDRLDYEGAHEGFGGPPYPGRWSLVLARSTDRGATWAESVVDDRLVPAERFIAFLPPFPSLAVDRRSGRVYAGFSDARLGAPDVWVRSLAPGAAAWSGAVRVNDTPQRDRTAQYLPKLAVAPDGRLDVVYYDRRADPGNRRNEVSLQSSADGGRSFGPRVALATRSFDSRIGFGSERGLPDLGSRLALESSADRALAVWADTRSGTDASNKQDLVAATAFFDRRPAARSATALRYGGLALALLALGMLFSPRPWARRYVRHPPT